VKKKPRRSTKSKPLRRRTRQVRQIPKGRRIDVRRDEFDRVIDILNERGELLRSMLRDLEVQFQRSAEMQRDLDLVKRAWVTVKNS
jgi:hypothetical protein